MHHLISILEEILCIFANIEIPEMNIDTFILPLHIIFMKIVLSKWVQNRLHFLPTLSLESHSVFEGQVHSFYSAIWNLLYVLG